MRSYIEIWGVMQALSIQQDAITELHKVIVGNKPKTGPAWSELRNLRHLTTGHPANRSQGVPGTQQSRPHRGHVGTSEMCHDVLRVLRARCHASRKYFERV